ncbi:MAG: TRAP transporter small permease subunit [Proteobacteria bacterium]|nr:TRAP transporter small permease subunit [Pseudomonadota bacterium]
MRRPTLIRPGRLSKMVDGWLANVDRAVAALIACGRWLVLPVTLVLFVQWPLRDLVQAYSREANDLGQWIFALYVSLAVTFATRERTHIAADALAHRYAAATRTRLARMAALICVVPWALFFLIAGAPMVWQSLRQLEAFPDTSNPGYFIIKASAWLLALLALAQALLDIRRLPAPR